MGTDTGKVTAVAYYRTSSANGLGDGKDSEERQRRAVTEYANRHGIEVVREFYDAAVKGTDPVGDREGFGQMLDYMMGNGARIVLVETANRFARDIMVQITGHEFLKKHGIDLIPVDIPQHFTDDNPTAEMVRNLLAVVSQFEKKSLVEKMKKARQRRRRETGRCEGRKPAPQEAIDMAILLRREGLSLRAIARALADEGFRVMERVPGTNQYRMTNKVYGAGSIKVMLRGSGNVQSK